MAIPSLSSYPMPQVGDFPKSKAGWAFAPERAALLIHDMQEYFVRFYGESNPLVDELTANIKALRAALKAQRAPVIYTAQPGSQSAEDRGLLNDMWGPGLNAHPELQQIVQALAPDGDDTVLAKWRYSAFRRSPLEQMLKEAGRDQLVICGVYGHIGCMTTALDAFMRDIKPFMVGDAIADFSLEDHLATLKYVAGRCGVVVGVDSLIGKGAPLTREEVEARVLALIEVEKEGFDPDENLIDYGLDSVQTMALATEWRKRGVDIGFVELAEKPTLNHWWALIESKLAAEAA